MMLFDLTLEKNLFFELDPKKIEQVEERTIGTRGETIVRTLAFSFKKHPQISSVSAVKRHYAYYDKCYIHLGDDLENAVSLREERTKDCLLELYSEIAPQYLKKDMDFEDRTIDLRQYFDVTKMPDERPKYAFPGLVTFEDMRNGNVEWKDGPSFPGIRMFSEEEKKSFSFFGMPIRADQNEPAYSMVEGYKKIEGESTEEKRENLLSELDRLKQQFHVDSMTDSLKEKAEGNSDGLKKEIDGNSDNSKERTKENLDGLEEKIKENPDDPRERTKENSDDPKERTKENPDNSKEQTKNSLEIEKMDE